jgi:hypothetical protein
MPSIFDHLNILINEESISMEKLAIIFIDNNKDCDEIINETIDIPDVICED